MSIKSTNLSKLVKLSDLGPNKHNQDASNTGSSKIFSVRPNRYAYPIGLSSKYPDTTNTFTSSSGGDVREVTGTLDAAQNTFPQAIIGFTSSGQFTPGFTGSVEVLVVAGGGSGGPYIGGGGAGGGVYYTNDYSVTSTANVYFTIGAGGAAQPSPTFPGNNGVNSILENDSPTPSTTTVLGGGGGGPGANSPREGNPGGSGGGSGRLTNNRATANPNYGSGPTGFYGHPGGQGTSNGGFDNGGNTGGGGGASRPGLDGLDPSPGIAGNSGSGSGGLDVAFGSLGTFWGAGGGGGYYGPKPQHPSNPPFYFPPPTSGRGTGGLGQPPGYPGAFSGGDGSTGLAGVPATNGGTNRGGGGGGGGFPVHQTGGTGGSGIAVIRYQCESWNSPNGLAAYLID